MTERRNQNYENKKPYNNYQGNGRRPQKKINKGLVIIKSTVFALAIVLITLAGAFVFIKNQKICKNNILSINSAAEIIKADKKSLLLKIINKDNIEILRVKNDDGCPKIINKIQIQK
jgi:hypothetical protein